MHPLAGLSAAIKYIGVENKKSRSSWFHLETNKSSASVERKGPHSPCI